MSKAGDDMEYLMTILRCAPVALQLAGGLVVITILSLSGSITDILNHSKVIATIPNDKSPRIYLNKELTRTSVEKNCEQVFSAIYIVLGTLGAVWAGDTTASGFGDMVVIAALAAFLWGIAKLVSNCIAKQNADRVRSIQRSEKTKGVIAYQKIHEDN